MRHTDALRRHVAYHNELKLLAEMHIKKALLEAHTVAAYPEQVMMTCMMGWEGLEAKAGEGWKSGIGRQGGGVVGRVEDMGVVGGGSGRQGGVVWWEGWRSGSGRQGGVVWWEGWKKWQR